MYDSPMDECCDVSGLFNTYIRCRRDNDLWRKLSPLSLVPAAVLWVKCVILMKVDETNLTE